MVGDRFFPATLNVDDPVVADELALPTVRRFKEAEHDGAAWSTETSGEFSKRITKDFGIGIEGAYLNQSQKAGGGNGFDNLGLSAKYHLFQSPEHEAILSAGIDWDIGGSGSKRVEAERFSTYTPQLFFGKGFGDLPDSADYIKPFAITGSVGVGLPSDKRTEDEGNPDTLKYAFTMQYSLPYLQQHVRDIGLTAPFDRLIPIVEFEFSKPLNRAEERRTTGTINPGFIWSGKSSQFGLEAVIPLNSKSGSGVGAMAQMHFYLDDLFPSSLGKPLLEW